MSIITSALELSEQALACIGVSTQSDLHEAALPDEIKDGLAALPIRPEPKELTELMRMYPGDGMYTRDGKYHVHRYADQFRITDIENAHRVGKVCRTLAIGLRYSRDPAKLHNFLIDLQEESGVKTLDQLMDHFKEKQDIDDIFVSVGEEKAKGVFNPMKLDLFKPLKEFPKRFTTDHLIRAIANAQYLELRQDFRYTDDYAMDAADNFGKRLGLNPVLELEGLIEGNLRVDYTKPTTRDDVIAVNYGAHSNDGRTALIKL